LSVFIDLELLENFIESLGMWGPLMFFLLQVIQVIIAPIPGNVLTVAGGVLFGLWPGFLLSYLANIVGSVLGFLLVRKAGYALLSKLVGSERFDKYMEVFSAKTSLSRIKVLFIIVVLLPFLPSDFACLAVALTPLSFRTFFYLVLTCRPWGQLAAALLGATSLHMPLGALIPIVVALFAVGAVTVYYASWVEETTVRWAHRLTDRLHKIAGAKTQKRRRQ